jgi:hypothetical protein
LSYGFASVQRIVCESICFARILLRAFAFFDFFDELRDDFEDVTDDAEVGILKNRRFGILIDRDDELGSFHARKVLHGAGDTAGDI